MREEFEKWYNKQFPHAGEKDYGMKEIWFRCFMAGWVAAKDDTQGVKK